MKFPKVPLEYGTRWTVNPPYYIRFKGVWDMQDFYESLVDWFRKRKYRFYEKIYKHKHPSPFGVERQYIWVAEVPQEDYFMIHYEIYFHTYDAHDIEVMTAKGPKIFTKGRIWIELRFWYIFDWEKRWDSSSFYSHLKTFYHNYVTRARFMEGWSPRLRKETFQLATFIKEKLNMESAQFESLTGAGHHRLGP